MDEGKRTPVGNGIEFRLTVWCLAGSGWRARVISADAAEREFASPFELARYLAWPVPPIEPGPQGLR